MIRSLEQIKADASKKQTNKTLSKSNTKPISKDVIGSGVTNMYEKKGMQQFLTKSHNPNFHIHGIKVPFNGIILGESGSGKTNILFSILEKWFSNTFHKMHIFTNECDEPLYKYISDTLPPWQLHISYKGYNGFLQFLRASKSNKEKSAFFGQSLCVFDDFACEKVQEEVEQQYIFGRKRSTEEDMGCTSIYLAQVYTSIPSTVRVQATFIIIVKYDDLAKLEYVFRGLAMGVTKDQLFNMYAFMRDRDRFGDFMLINKNERDVKKRVRINFDEFLDPDDF